MKLHNLLLSQHRYQPIPGEKAEMVPQEGQF